MMRISPRDLAPNMSYSLAAAAAAIGLNSTQNPDHQKGRDFRHAGRTTITVHPRPMSSAPLDGTPVRFARRLLFREHRNKKRIFVAGPGGTTLAVDHPA